MGYPRSLAFELAEDEIHGLDRLFDPAVGAVHAGQVPHDRVSALQDESATEGGLDRDQHVVAVDPQAGSALLLLRPDPLHVARGAADAAHGLSLASDQLVVVPHELERRIFGIAAI